MKILSSTSRIINNSIVEKVTLFNILGQAITSMKIKNREQQIIQMPIKSINSGVEIIKTKKTQKEN